ncbi:unnamed protein product [Acanthosepion pharaonis]|uniref:Uncharacterized protein n=1 Tax=Acanthosepion pharaonis TaxID=158019 RepID=A0A812CUC8_ACAPH|nr:unnamed protein product [Sepia pharaonis]
MVRLAICQIYFILFYCIRFSLFLSPPLTNSHFIHSILFTSLLAVFSFFFFLILFLYFPLTFPLFCDNIFLPFFWHCLLFFSSLLTIFPSFSQFVAVPLTVFLSSHCFFFDIILSLFLSLSFTKLFLIDFTRFFFNLFHSLTIYLSLYFLSLHFHISYTFFILFLLPVSFSYLSLSFSSNS